MSSDRVFRTMYMLLIAVSVLGAGIHFISWMGVCTEYTCGPGSELSQALMFTALAGIFVFFYRINQNIGGRHV